MDSDENDYAHLLTAPKRAAGPHGSQPARGAAADAAAAERSYINVTKEGVPIRDYVNLQDSIGKAGPWWWRWWGFVSCRGHGVVVIVVVRRRASLFVRSRAKVAV